MGVLLHRRPSSSVDIGVGRLLVRDCISLEMRCTKILFAMCRLCQILYVTSYVLRLCLFCGMISCSAHSLTLSVMRNRFPCEHVPTEHLRICTSRATHLGLMWKQCNNVRDPCTACK